MLKREWGAESNGKLLHLFIPNKTVTEFTMEDLPLGRIAALVPEFAVKGLPLGTDDDDVLQLWKNPKKTSTRKTDPTWDRTWAR